MKHFYCAKDAYLKVFSFLAGLFLLLPFSSFAQEDIKLEGEEATLTGVAVDTTAAGYSGSGYVWGFDNPEDHITFTFPATAGKYNLIIQYHSPFGEKGYGLQVNGVSSEQRFTGTGEGFGSVTVGEFDLLEGENTITITNGWGYYGIDYIALSPVSDQPPVVVPVVDGKVEAEDAALNGVAVDTTTAGYSGSGYVWGFDNATDKVSFNVEVDPGLYEITIGYISPFGDKGYDFQVNNESGGGMFAGTGQAFSTVSAGKYLLQEGLNKITIGNGWGYFGIDYIMLTPTTVPLPAKPPKELADAQATVATKALFSYLVDIYGSKILSGQQDNTDYIVEQTGKEPAVGAFDFMDYSPSRVAFGTDTLGRTQRYIDWAQKEDGNGIVSMMWHWNAPTDLINEAPDRLWWRGFYTNATTFKLDSALADTTSERYHLLIRDIDAIAHELQKFSNADIPVLWRPLHEAPGGWFWWGARGPEAFKELWHIMYERMTNYHNLHNLIWVYTATTDMDWYPGDAYVDIVGLDIYTDPTANMSGDWESIQALFGGEKLVTLSETGNLPEPDKVRAYATWWSWFSVWSGDFIFNQPVSLLQEVYHDEDVITRDELPNWRMYGLPVVELTQPADQSEFLLCDLPVLSAEATDENGTVSQIIFKANDQIIGLDETADDGWHVAWTDAQPGTYAVVAIAVDDEGNQNTSSPVTVTIKADEEAPLMTMRSNETILWPPNHQMTTFTLDELVAEVTDNCSDSIALRIKQVSSDESAGLMGKLGIFRDIIISDDGQSMQLRAERNGRGNGRVYTIEVEATDAYGNQAIARHEVKVPHSKKQPAIADAIAYTVQHDAVQPDTPEDHYGEIKNKVFALLDQWLTVYPNPTSTGELYVSLHLEEAQALTISLVNTNSQQVLSFNQQLNKGGNAVQVPVDQVKNGLYLLVISNDQHRISRRVLIIKN